MEKNKSTDPFVKYLLCVCSKAISEVLSRRSEDKQKHREMVQSGDVKVKLQAAIGEVKT